MYKYAHIHTSPFTMPTRDVGQDNWSPDHRTSSCVIAQ